jgi:signal peptidase
VLAVQSGSMEPAIHTGSVVIVAPQNDYKIGEIITFGELGETKIPITHRIHDIKIVNGESVFITKGDANDVPDKNETPRSEVKGKVLFSIPLLGYLINFIKKPLGFALVIIVPALWIVFGEIKKIIAEVKKEKNGKNTANDNNNAIENKKS